MATRSPNRRIQRNRVPAGTQSAQVRAMTDAIVWFAAGSSVPIYVASRQQQYPIGTGTLLRVREHRFLVTAAHVAAQGSASKQLALPTARSGSQVITLGNNEVLRGARSEHDVAIIALQDEKTIEIIQRSWTFLEPRSIAAPRWRALHLVYGYQEPRLVRQSGLTPPGQAIAFATTPLRKTPAVPSQADDPDDQNDLFFELRSQSLQLEGPTPVNTPDFRGVSGASVWEFVPTDDNKCWSPERQLRIVAIQAGQLAGKYIRAKRWHLLWSAFRQYDPSVASTLRAAITRSIPRDQRSEQPRPFRRGIGMERQS